MVAQHDRTEERMHKVGAVVIALAILLIGAGVLVGLLASPVGFVGVAVGVVALFVSRQYVEGRRGNVITPGQEDEANPDVVAAESASATAAEPYTRED